MLRYIREAFGNGLILRVDANGAFSENDALQKLNRLSELQIHSIEQPVKAGENELLKKLCQDSALPIALDESLIGLMSNDEREELLDFIKPHYIILKPTLLGGFKDCNDWIEIAEERKIGWWLTSALESNIGLNAIAQYASHLNTAGHQGLGTGQLYTNNLESPLIIEKGTIHYDKNGLWQSFS